MAKIYLDALIPRDDFEVSAISNIEQFNKTTINITDLLTDSFFYPIIRKPDFQRETNEWDAQNVADFIESFVKGDLIPAIIFWRSPSGNCFVIDGAHRLSSLIAWVNDDYGDGILSKRFYETIPETQLREADRARKIINQTIGSYADLKKIISNPAAYPNEIKKLQYAKKIATAGFQLQWVTGDAQSAETSFFKINQKAVQIDKTEIKLLKSRKKPNCIAARAIIRGGKGHKYWECFSEDNQKVISQLAREINELLFHPLLKSPIKTLDLPIAGKSLSGQTLPLILDLVNMINNVPINNDLYSIPDDVDGSATIDILKKTKKIIQLVNSNEAGSLGLHPAIYFYSADGRHKVTSFYSIIALVLYLKEHNKLPWFTKNRALFEKFLIEYEYITQQLSRKYRSSSNAYIPMRDFYLFVLEQLDTGIDIKGLVAKIIEKYNYLTLQQNNEGEVDDKFSSETKSAAFLKTALKSAIKCGICGGYVHTNAVSFDHIQRKQDGGKGNIENCQITHPYCNTGYKH